MCELSLCKDDPEGLDSLRTPAILVSVVTSSRMSFPFAFFP